MKLNILLSLGYTDDTTSCLEDTQLAVHHHKQLQNLQLAFFVTRCLNYNDMLRGEYSGTRQCIRKTLRGDHCKI